MEDKHNSDIPVKRRKQYDCPVRDILDRIGDAWTFLVIRRLAGGTMRFNELKRSLDGISQRMLTVTLRNLERDGLLQREISDRPTVQVFYSLTELGRSLLAPMEILFTWASKEQQTIREARKKYDTFNNNTLR